MGLDDFTPVESSEGGSNSAEISESFKEAFKKGSGGVKKTRKDEKKAKKYDFLLAKFLVEMIMNKKYDDILSYLFICLDKGYATNFLLGVLSLAYEAISDEIRKNSGKENIRLTYTEHSEAKDFDDHSLDENLKKRINLWIEDIEDVITINPSLIASKKTIENLKTDDSIVDFTREVFIFFLEGLHINISKAKAENYATFIVGELGKILKRIDLEDLNF